ncbi:MAG: radical SAM protein [Candidatus Cloacimonetes bacterium]|nr:radical SAM protein [Candidatus Cloacimonadota bacterium]
MKEIEAKCILVPNKGPSSWFGIKYNFNVYRACPHGCIYCDSRSECYQITDFNDIEAKINAPDLLDKTLAGKRKKCVLGTGSMSDPYLPLEKERCLTQKCIEQVIKHKFGLHIVTKSSLIERDLPLFQEFKETHLSVAITITSAFDAVSEKIEPYAPLSSRRFKTIEILSQAGIFTGILMMPMLPFISDNKKNVLSIIQKAKDAGASYIFPWFSVTLRDRQREYFYQKLDEIYPGLKRQYQMRYKNNYHCDSPNASALYDFFYEMCDKYQIISKMEHLPWINNPDYYLKKG